MKPTDSNKKIRVIAELQSVTVATVAGEKRFGLGVFSLKVMAKGGGKIGDLLQKETFSPAWTMSRV